MQSVKVIAVRANISIPESLSLARPPPCKHESKVTETPAESWKKFQGRFAKGKHIIGPVPVDVATFQVSHATRFDLEATTLRAKRAKSGTPVEC